MPTAVLVAALVVAAFVVGVLIAVAVLDRGRREAHRRADEGDAELRAARTLA